MVRKDVTVDRGGYKESEMTYSNCRAAIFEGKPVTIVVISHGRNVEAEVRVAPPTASPLCCFRRRGGFGVEPTYNEA